VAEDADGELDEVLSKLTTLQLVQVFIMRLADDLPTPGKGMDNGALAMSLLGQRAKSLYANFQLTRQPRRVRPRFSPSGRSSSWSSSPSG
jgi:hypothetical protein